MNFSEKDLILAQQKGIINAETFEELIKLFNENNNQENFSETTKTKKKFTLENFLYYFGAILIICTMGWYLGNIWDSFGHGGLLVLCILYFLLFTVIGNFLWKKNKTTPGGLLYTCAVSVVPLAVWSFQSLVGIMPKNMDDYTDFHRFIRAGWIFMELATIAVGILFLKYRKFPFLTLPICYATWYLAMDIVPICLGNIHDAPTWGMRNFATFVFALILLGSALHLDKKFKEDFSGWLYIFGSTMLWGVILSIMGQFRWDNEPVYFLFALFCLAYMIISILVQRKVFMVWGAIGIIGYLGHLAYDIFENSPIFPLVIIALGLAIIFSGIYYTKNCDKIEKTLRKFIFGK